MTLPQKRHRKLCFSLSLISLLAFVVVLLISSPLTENALAADITLAWDQNPESDITGYKIYYGLQSRVYSYVIDVGTHTSCTIAGLEKGLTYYIAATAYDQSGNESAYSSEIITSSAAGSPASGGGGGGGGGCFIATAAYGSYIEPEVMILRKFRDNHLLTNPVGKAFVSFYYKTSPPIADYIRKHETLRTATRWLLTPIAYGVKYCKISFMVILTLMVIALVRTRKKRVHSI